MKTPRLTPKNVISKARVLFFAAAAVATLAGSSVAEGAAFTWTPTAANDNYMWTDTANWAGGAYPNAAGAVVNINNDIAGDQNINLPTGGITLGTLNIGDSGGGASNAFSIALNQWGAVRDWGTDPLKFQGANAGDPVAINGTGLGTSTTNFWYPVIVAGGSPLTITQNGAQALNFGSTGGTALTGNTSNINLVVNGVVSGSNGGIQILSLSGSGTLTKSGIGMASVSANSSGFTGNVVIQMGEFQVGQTGNTPTSYLGTTSYTVSGNSNPNDSGGTRLNVHTLGVGNVGLNPSAVVNLAGGGFQFDGAASSVTPLAFQAINLTQGASRITLNQECAVTLSQINRSPGATGFIVSGSNQLGLAADGAVVRMTVTTPIPMIGGGGDKTTTTGSIVPWMWGNFGWSGGAYTFITQDTSTGGLRMLSASEYASSIASGTTSSNNISINNTNGDTVSANTTINSLNLYYQWSSSAAFSISSGAKLSVASGALILQKGNVVGAGTLQFGTTATPAEGVIYVPETASIAINANIQGTLGLTKGSTGTLILGGANNTGLTGTVTVAGGILQAGAVNALGNNTDVVLANSNNNTFSSPYNNVVTTLNLAGFNQTVASLSGGGAYGGNVALGGATLTVGAGATPASTTYGGVISGAGNLTKTGASTLTLTGANTYTGATTVNAGTLLVSGGGTLNATSGISITGGTLNYQNNTTGLNRNITVNGGTFKNNSTQNYTGTLTFTSGTVGGTNLSGIALTIGSGQTISPGNSPGTVTTGAQTWSGGGTYVWEINNATGSQGTNWDFINGVGALDISGLTSGSTFHINLIGLTAGNVSGAVSNWNGSLDGQWKIGTFSSITGTFASNLFNVDTSGFTNNNAAPGTFSVSNVGSDLFLNYVAVPEPATWALLAFSLTTVMVMRRRRSS